MLSVDQLNKVRDFSSSSLFPLSLRYAGRGKEMIRRTTADDSLNKT